MMVAKSWETSGAPGQHQPQRWVWRHVNLVYFKARKLSMGPQGASRIDLNMAPLSRVGHSADRKKQHWLISWSSSNHIHDHLKNICIHPCIILYINIILYIYNVKVISPTLQFWQTSGAQPPKRWRAVMDSWARPPSRARGMIWCFILQDGVRRIVKLKYKRFNYDFDLW